MSKLSATHAYRQPDSNSEARATNGTQKVATEFQAMVIDQILEPMFKPLAGNGYFGGGVGEELWEPLIVQEFARQMASQDCLRLMSAICEAVKGNGSTAR